jgi:hypothetical protein
MPGIAKGAPSRRGRVSNLVLELTREHGVAVHLDEIDAEYRRRYPEDAVFDMAPVIGQLCASDVLVYVYGRPPHGRYAHREHVVNVVPPNEPLAAAVTVVEHLWEETGAEAPTATVTDGMRALGVDLPDPRNYRLILDALTRPSTRGAAAWRPARLSVRTVTTRDGRQRTLWRPAGAPIPDERVPVTQADAAMEVIAETTRALGRPASRVEAALWVATHPAHTAAAAVAQQGDLGRGLEQLSERRTQRLVNGRGNWRVVRSERTALGGAPERYAVYDITPTMTAAMDLKDRLRTFRPHEECESLSAARVLAARLRVPALADVIAMREALLEHALRPISEEPRLPAVLALIEQANETLVTWAARTPVNARSGKLEPMVDLRRQIDALQRLRACHCAPARAVRIVGGAATVSHQALLPYAANVPRLLDRAYASDESLRMFYDRARRLPNPDARWTPNAETGSLIPPEREGMGWMLVDRVDAMTGIMDAVSPPRATTLLHGARALLGHVLRDADVLRDALGAIPPTRSDARRPIILALALLGEAVVYEEAVPRPEDEMDTAVYLLSLVLRESDRRRLQREVLRVIAGAASAEARRTANEADRLVGSGMLLSLVG